MVGDLPKRRYKEVGSTMPGTIPGFDLDPFAPRSNFFVYFSISFCHFFCASEAGTSAREEASVVREPRFEAHMAAVQGVNNMTLSQQEKMYTAVQTNCVIVSAGFGAPTNSVIQSKRALAPAPERNTVLIANNTKRKIQFMSHSGPPVQPASVARRNARERNRVKQVNNGFAALRQHIPANVLAAFAPAGSPAQSTSRGANKKLSKVETLKMAVEYIRSLQQMLEDHEADLSSKSEDNCDNRFYASSPDPISQQYASYPLILPTPPSSESSVSPTPSHTSDASSGTVFTTATVYKQYGYENYEPHSPEDEELLDAIFSWQQNSW